MKVKNSWDKARASIGNVSPAVRQKQRRQPLVARIPVSSPSLSHYKDALSQGIKLQAGRQEKELFA
jgi:hypothetical protein